MYRVRDIKRNVWVNDVYLYPNDRLFTYKKRLFGSDKLTMLPDKEHVIHMAIAMKDKRGTTIYEGDVLRYSEDDAEVNITGVVAYSKQTGGYNLFDEENETYYPLNDSVCSELEIIGNVFDGEWRTA